MLEMDDWPFCTSPLVYPSASHSSQFSFHVILASTQTHIDLAYISPPWHLYASLANPLPEQLHPVIVLYVTSLSLCCNMTLKQVQLLPPHFLIAPQRTDGRQCQTVYQQSDDCTVSSLLATPSQHQTLGQWNPPSHHPA